MGFLLRSIPEATALQTSNISLKQPNRLLGGRVANGWITLGLLSKTSSLQIFRFPTIMVPVKCSYQQLQTHQILCWVER